MQGMTRIAVLAACLWTTMLGGALCTPSDAQAAQTLNTAFEQMRAGDWDAALAAAGAPGSVSRDIVEWHRLRAGGGSAADAMDFLDRRPDWPGLAWLRQRSEPAIVSAGRDAMIAFFAENPPQTPEGVLGHAAVLAAAGNEGDAEAELVMAWRTMPMGATVQGDYLEKHRKLLAPHHAARLDRMLWDGHMESARRMVPLVDDGQGKLAEARIALYDMAPGVDTRIEAVPESLRDAPGLAHARFVWRDRKKGRDEDAIELLLERSKTPALLGEPDKWAKRRVALARQDMRNGNPERAYRIASFHHTTPEAGYIYADLEWTAGFIALRLLGDPATALRHFQRFEAAVDSPISKGRAGYWIGRAQEALGNPDGAQAGYALGAGYQTSFYGLLAAEQIGRGFDSNLADPPALPDWREADFMQSSVLEAALLLLKAGEDGLAERFLTHLVESLDPVAAGQLGNMVLDMGHPHLAVMIGKRAARGGVVLPAAYYPLHPLADLDLPMAKEMTLAIARRESEFDPVVVSHAGARGLMQVMPTTAEAVAADMGILASHRSEMLLSDWRYNAKLGARYLAGLAGDLKGNVVMMSAGYNAGPGRPIRWAQTYGDPRTGAVDIVDWIEMIPFDETRNYVMRVTESLPIYRARLGKAPLPIPFSQELTGSTLLAFAP